MHRELDLLLPVELQHPAVDQRRHLVSALARQLFRRQLDLELQPRPVADRPPAPVLQQKLLALRQVDGRHRLHAFSSRSRRQVVPADLLQLAVVRLQAPARVDLVRHRLPVPLLGVLGRRGSRRSSPAAASRPSRPPCRGRSSRPARSRCGRSRRRRTRRPAAWPRTRRSSPPRTPGPGSARRSAPICLSIMSRIRILQLPPSRMRWRKP